MKHILNGAFDLANLTRQGKIKVTIIVTVNLECTKAYEMIDTIVGLTCWTTRTAICLGVWYLQLDLYALRQRHAPLGELHAFVP